MTIKCGFIKYFTIGLVGQKCCSSRRTDIVSFRKPRRSEAVPCGVWRPQISMAISGEIEVEQKFQLTAEVRQNLLSLSCEKEVIRFRDQYFDEDLALQDKWLRKRNEEWELKVPSRDNRSSGPTVYKELNGIDEITACLPNLDIDSVVCYATLETERTQMTFPWNDYRVNITLDECHSNDGFRCAIGELELMVKDECEVASAIEELDKLANYFAVSKLDDKEGKLLKYLRLHRPALFKRFEDLERV